MNKVLNNICFLSSVINLYSIAQFYFFNLVIKTSHLEAVNTLLGTGNINTSLRTI